MKKLLMAILALTLALSFTACGEDSKKDDKKEETKQTEVANDNAKKEETEEKEDKTDSKSAAKETVKNFMDAFCKLDADGMAKYVDGELPEEFTSVNLTAVKDETISSLPAEMDAYKPQFASMFDSLIDEMIATISYDITSVEKTGDEVTVKVDMTMANFDNLEDAINNALSSGLQEEIMKIASEALESGDLSENATEQELMDYIMPKLFDAMSDLFSAEVSKLDKTTTNFDFVVSEVNGEWLINADK